MIPRNLFPGTVRPARMAVMPARLLKTNFGIYTEVKFFLTFARERSMLLTFAHESYLSGLFRVSCRRGVLLRNAWWRPGIQRAPAPQTKEEVLSLLPSNRLRHRPSQRPLGPHEPPSQTLRAGAGRIRRDVEITGPVVRLLRGVDRSSASSALRSRSQDSSISRRYNHDRKLANTLPYVQSGQMEADPR